jgi:hypothetical protein
MKSIGICVWPCILVMQLPHSFMRFVSLYLLHVPRVSRGSSVSIVTIIRHDDRVIAVWFVANQKKTYNPKHPPGLVHVRFVVDEVVMAQVFLRVPRPSSVSTIPKLLSTHSFIHHRRYKSVFKLQPLCVLYILDWYTANPQPTHFVYLVNTFTYLIFWDMLHNSHFFVVVHKMLCIL